MPGVLIRDMPEDVHQKLKARAAANRRSLGREALVLLEKALEDPQRRPTLEEIDAIRVKPRKPLTSEFILKAIRTGRS